MTVVMCSFALCQDPLWLLTAVGTGRFCMTLTPL
jgi:hypothetical protein